MPVTISDSDLNGLPPEIQRLFREGMFAEQLVEKMEREFGQNYLLMSGLLVGDLFVILGRFGHNLIYYPQNAIVFLTPDVPVTAATAEWRNKIKEEVLAFCDKGDEMQIARVLKRMCQKMGGTIFSNACPPSISGP